MSKTATKITIGIDEAGRGPLLGPMVIAAVAVSTPVARRLSRFGVRDSKNYGNPQKARKKRAELASLIRQWASVSVEVIDVATIDDFVQTGGLNRLECEAARRLIRRLGNADRIVADGKLVFRPLLSEFDQLECHNDGESVHVSVAAASIIAKDRRDFLFQKIARRYEPEFGPLAGGGYINSPTRDFVASFEQLYGHPPPEVRRSWGAKK